MGVRALILFAVVILASPVLADESYDVPFELSLGESVAVGPDGLVVGLESLVQDSRCPLDVECVWAGDAEAALFAERPTFGVDRFSLHTHVDLVQETKIDIWHITLLQVSPYPRVAGDPTEPGEVRVTLLVTLENALSTESLTWSHLKALHH